MLWLIFLIGAVLLFAFLIDWKRQRINNHGEAPINSHAKPGEDSNYSMGNHHYHDGGGGGES